jgi:solute:Na+ symporter, SSS family
MTIEYISIIIYLAFLVGLGIWASKLNNSVSDFVRGGSKAAWWMVGTSMFVSGISAFTFTGNASAAFLSGPTFLIIYVAGGLGYLLCAILAPWFRQTRAETWADVMRERFGVSVEQFSVSISLIMAPLSGAIQLYALAVFANVLMPEIPIHWLIIVLGGVAVAYSTSGGRWAVLTTDFVQGIIMFAVTLLVCHLSLKAVGGWGAFFGYFSDPRFTEDFKFVKEPGAFSGDRYTLKWIVVIFIMQIQGYINLGTAGRFLSVKDGPSARKAAIMAAVLTFVGAAVWFVPPMAARFVMQDAVLAMDIKEPATASYAVIALKLLPNGLSGLLLAAMFAATMSSLDSSLNGTAGILIKNCLPFVRRLFRLPVLSDAAGLCWAKLSTIFFGAAVVIIACGLSAQQEFELFDAFLLITAVIGLPLGLPVLVGLWVKRLHWASYYIIVAFSSVPSAYFIFQERSGHVWHIQDRLPWIYLGGLAGLLVSKPLWRFAGEAYKESERGFFKKMHTPIDFEAEVGEANDSLQLRMVGFSSLLMGVMVACLMFVPNTLEQRLQVLFIALFMAVIGGFFAWKSRQSQKRFNRYQREAGQVTFNANAASKSG